MPTNAVAFYWRYERDKIYSVFIMGRPANDYNGQWDTDPVEAEDSFLCVLVSGDPEDVTSLLTCDFILHLCIPAHVIVPCVQTANHRTWLGRLGDTELIHT